MWVGVLGLAGAAKFVFIFVESQIRSISRVRLSCLHKPSGGRKLRAASSCSGEAGKTGQPYVRVPPIGPQKDGGSDLGPPRAGA